MSIVEISVAALKYFFVNIWIQLGTSGSIRKIIKKYSMYKE